MNIFDNLIDDATDVIKTVLRLSINYHIDLYEIKDEEKIELKILSKFITQSSLEDIIKILDINFEDDTISLTPTDELTEYIEKEYQKYKTLNIKK